MKDSIDMSTSEMTWEELNEIRESEKPKRIVTSYLDKKLLASVKIIQQEFGATPNLSKLITQLLVEWVEDWKEKNKDYSGRSKDD